MSRSLFSTRIGTKSPEGRAVQFLVDLVDHLGDHVGAEVVEALQPVAHVGHSSLLIGVNRGVRSHLMQPWPGHRVRMNSL
jgi:hypothetical protein